MAFDVPGWPCWCELEILLELGLAMLLAAAIGWERERKSRPAVLLILGRIETAIEQRAGADAGG